jgi:hypothetical protein
MRARVRVMLRHGWIAGRKWVTPRLQRWVDRIESRLGVIPEREWFDEVDRAADDSFPASDPPSHSTLHSGTPKKPTN